LGLPERHDKRDAMVLASSLSGFQVEFFPGVRGEDVPDIAKPPVWAYLEKPVLLPVGANSISTGHDHEGRRNGWLEGPYECNPEVSIDWTYCKILHQVPTF
jgi:hypothetical protein